jgi:hypothetical protein
LINQALIEYEEAITTIAASTYHALRDDPLSLATIRRIETDFREADSKAYITWDGIRRSDSTLSSIAKHRSRIADALAAVHGHEVELMLCISQLTESAYELYRLGALQAPPAPTTRTGKHL